MSYQLIGGPYRPPRCRIGRALYDILRGDLVVLGISDAPIPWPIGTTHPGCRPLPIMTAELVRAIRTEAELAVCHWFGISRWTVCKWRRALMVPRFNEGTLAIWIEAAQVKLGPEERAKAHQALRRNRANRR